MRAEEEIFDLSSSTCCDLHAIAARNEALECGTLCSEGVTIAGTSYIPPPKH